MVRPFNAILSGTCLPEAEVQLPGSSSNVPDAVLMPDTLDDYPLEVGFTETLEELYVDAERLPQGTNGAIELVVLIKVVEKNRHVQNEHPRGGNPESVKKLGRNEIARVIDVHFVSKGLNVVGEMDVQAFLSGMHRETRRVLLMMKRRGLLFTSVVERVVLSCSL